MTANFTTVRVADIALEMGDAPFGSDLKTDDYTEGGALVVQGKNIQGRVFDWSDRRHVSLEKWRSIPRSHCFPGDLIFPKVGTIGKIGILSECSGVEHYLLSTNTMRLRVDPKKANPLFIYYYFTWSRTVDLITALNSKSVQPVFNFTTLRNFLIDLPPLTEQRAIAHILGTLDDKIELNRRMNETLEAMARAIFKSWFVDFDPVRAKAEGRDPCLPKHIADLFPDRFEDSELGEIPVGWEVGPILKRAKLLSGGTPKTDRNEYWDGDVLWASAKDVSQCGQTFLVKTERTITRKGLEESATQLIPSFCTVVVARGATTGRMVMFGLEMAMNQTCYALASITDTPFALYCHLRHEIDDLVRSAHGSVFDTITTSTFANSKIVIPSDSVLKTFEQKVSPIFHRVLANTDEIQTLATLRDTLLPKLLSGELRVSQERYSARMATSG